MSGLLQHSVDVILSNQSASGAWVASPSFPTYRYSWLRDGSFIAHAMDRVGRFESARSFFCWVGRTLRRYAPKADRMLRGQAGGGPLDLSDCLHTRFSLDGEEVPGEWGDFQLDGYGTWLWALAEHVRMSGDAALLLEVADSVDLTLRYLTALWQVPNYDCWEEHPEQLHPYTLAAIYAGLRAAASLHGGRVGLPASVAEEVRAIVLARAVQDGHVVKAVLAATGEPESAAVDASLLGLMVPYGLLSPGEPIAQATLARIERDLHRPGGGVYRYRTDTYYGGGEWILLAAWLGWYYAEVGDVSQARQLLAWVEAQADDDGDLPEQVSAHLLAPGCYAGWQARWGPVAKPLLWSHAMHLILAQALERKS